MYKRILPLQVIIYESFGKMYNQQLTYYYLNLCMYILARFINLSNVKGTLANLNPNSDFTRSEWTEEVTESVRWLWALMWLARISNILFDLFLNTRAGRRVIQCPRQNQWPCRIKVLENAFNNGPIIKFPLEWQPLAFEPLELRGYACPCSYFIFQPGALNLKGAWYMYF